MTSRLFFLAAGVAVAIWVLPSGVARAQANQGNSLTSSPYGPSFVPPSGNPRDKQQPEYDPALAARPDAKAMTPMTPGINSNPKEKLPTEAPWLAIEKRLDELRKHQPNALDKMYVGPVAQGDEVSDMSMPHRSQKEVADWLVLALSEVMSMDYEHYEPHLQQMRVGMNDHAVAQLMGFMEQSNILNTLKDQNYLLRCYVEEQPTLLNKGAVDGRYRWLYELPINLSFMPPNIKSYENTQAVANQHIIIRVQVGRMPEKQGIDQLMIETFEVRQNTAKQQTANNH